MDADALARHKKELQRRYGDMAESMADLLLGAMEVTYKEVTLTPMNDLLKEKIRDALRFYL